MSRTPACATRSNWRPTSRRSTSSRADAPCSASARVTRPPNGRCPDGSTHHRTPAHHPAHRVDGGDRTAARRRDGDVRRRHRRAAMTRRSQRRARVHGQIPLLIGGNNQRLLEFAGATADIVGIAGLGRTRHRRAHARGAVERRTDRRLARRDPPRRTRSGCGHPRSTRWCSTSKSRTMPAPRRHDLPRWIPGVSADDIRSTSVRAHRHGDRARPGSAEPPCAMGHRRGSRSEPTPSTSPRTVVELLGR